MKKIGVGLIGIGTIGRGVFDAIVRNGGLIGARAGIELEIKGVCDKDPSAIRDIELPEGAYIAESPDRIFADSSVDIVVELIGGINPAREFVLEAIEKGKHVVTANKALLSKHWKEILSAAKKRSVFVKYEASVGGAIPIIRSLTESFAANRFEAIYGILNGTTNFILTMMEDKGLSFEDALKMAQEMGLAESDPTLDISGMDSAHKISILSLLGYGVDVSAEDIYTEGITEISPVDMINAANWGYRVKLLAIAKTDGKRLDVRVHPTMVPDKHLLAGVTGEDNAIFVKGDLVEESLLLGKGAGRKPTASSVMGDLIDIGVNIAYSGGKDLSDNKFCYASDETSINDMDDLEMSYYLRFSVIDEPGVLSGISTVLAENNISIAKVSQEERKMGETVPVIILTHNAAEGKMMKAIEKIDSMDFISGKTVLIRIED